MRAKEVMTQRVVGISPQASIADAIARMLGHHVSSMPVVDADRKLVGIVCEGDFVRRAEIQSEDRASRWLELLLGAGARMDEYARSHGRTVADVMSRDVVTVGPDTPLDEVVRLMHERGVKRVPVLDGDRVVGIVSRSDVLMALAHLLGEPKHEPTSDESVREAIVADMRKQTWTPLPSA